MKNIITSETKVFSLFGKSGAMEQIKPIPELPIGCKIYCYGYGMSEREGAIISPRNQFGQYKCVYISDFESGFFTLEEYSRPHSKKFGIGNYFDDNFLTIEESILEDYILKAEIAVNIKNEIEKEKETFDKNELKEIPKRFPHLTVNTQDDQNITKKNLVADLKKNFPLVKFSVKKSHYSTYYISWTDGPAEIKVEEIASKFEGYTTDETGDFRDPNPSNFNKVFGDFKYVFYSRSASEHVSRCKENLQEIIGSISNSYPSEAGDIFYKTFRHTSFPIGVNVKCIQMKNNFSGSFTDSFEFVFENNEESTAEISKESNNSIFLVDYSLKAVAVFGNTKEIKDQLKELGGKFNNYLTYNNIKQAGWIFSNKKKEELKNILNL
ncbi:LPD29 domain-containing protein [Flavobacterium sp. GSB-24]|uniref:LPD29 domain-containing protein n=1 Tax=Flavobacterium sp. GSB-24 TaxID=2994319 RepID=UPI002491159E|nr:LPD29 domain-containing protein [Flavobacterium sp. GSB-24]BDU27657.1 hypothetical protein FLGSB24_44010 [Flavobacterium sp. GSB-24]